MKNLKRFLALVLCCAVFCCLVPCTPASAELIQDEYGDYRYTTFEDLKVLCSRTFDEYTYASYPTNDGPTIVIKESITIPDNLELDGQYVTFVVPKGVTVTVSENSRVYVYNWDVKGTLVNHGQMQPYNLTVSGTMRNDGYVSLSSGGVSDLIVTGKIENSGTIEVQCGTDPESAGTVSGLDKIKNTDGGKMTMWYPYVYDLNEMKNVLADAEKYPGISYSMTLMAQEPLTIDSNLVIPKNASVFFPSTTDNMSVTVAKGCTLTNNGWMDFTAPVTIKGTLCNEGEIKFRMWDESIKIAVPTGGKYTGNGVLWVWYAEDPQTAFNGLNLDKYLVLRNENYYDDYVWGIWPKNVKADVTRLAGDNRFGTAFKAADEMLSNSNYGYFDTIIIANGYNFADALSGSYLANVTGAPILLCWSGDSRFDFLNDDVVEYITENLNGVSGTVYLLGGTSAVPQSLEDELNAYAEDQIDVTIKRLAGADRFETNLMILEEAGVNPGDEILVCTGTNYADSLSASGTGKPILLAFNEYGAFFGGQEAYLKTLKNCSFTIIGGESAVSKKLEDAFRKYGSVDRLAGGNRFETSVLVAEKYFEDPHTAVLAYAWNFPDGLCGGPLAFDKNAPLILTMTGFESAAVKYFEDKSIIDAYVLGSGDLISDGALRKIFGLAQSAEIESK